MKNVFPSPHPLVAHKLALLRSIDTDPKNFRELVREIAALMTYEATADLMTKPVSVETPLATAPGRRTLAVILEPFNSRLIERVSVLMKDLVAEYTATT